MYESFAVSALPARERFDYFQALVADVFCPMHVQRTGGVGEDFRAQVEAHTLGCVRLARVVSSPMSVQRFGADVACLTEAPYLIKFQMKGESLWSQRNRSVHLKPGDFVVASMAEPYTLRFRDDYEMPVLALSQRTMRALTPNPDQFLGHRMSGEDADCGLLSSFVGQVVSRMSRLSEPMISKVESNILDLLGGVLSARASDGVASAAQQLTQMKAYIARHLHERQLGPAMIAQACGVSTRHVHALFASEPLSVGRYIRARRLEASRRLLDERPGASLTDIALECGFYDLSHLSRCFREEYGRSPREYRAALATNGHAPACVTDA